MVMGRDHPRYLFVRRRRRARREPGPTTFRRNRVVCFQPGLTEGTTRKWRLRRGLTDEADCVFVGCGVKPDNPAIVVESVYDGRGRFRHIDGAEGFGRHVV